jgi:type II secretory pathway component PulM
MANYGALQKAAVEQFQDPFRFRIFVTMVAVAIAYCGVYQPLSGKIAEAKRELKRETEREGLAQEVELLRAQREYFAGRLRDDTDANEWIQYVLEGVRNLPLELINLDSDEERKAGPYKCVAMRLSVSGECRHLDALLHWLETDERIFRIDSLSIEPSRGEETNRLMNMTLLGLRG